MPRYQTTPHLSEARDIQDSVPSYQTASHLSEVRNIQGSVPRYQTTPHLSEVRDIQDSVPRYVVMSLYQHIKLLITSVHINIENNQSLSIEENQ